MPALTLFVASLKMYITHKSKIIVSKMGFLSRENPFFRLPSHFRHATKKDCTFRTKYYIICMNVFGFWFHAAKCVE